MGTADEQDRTFSRDVECASGTDLPKEDVDDHPPEEKDQIV